MDMDIEEMMNSVIEKLKGKIHGLEELNKELTNRLSDANDDLIRIEKRLLKLETENKNLKKKQRELTKNVKDLSESKKHLEFEISQVNRTS